MPLLVAAYTHRVGAFIPNQKCIASRVEGKTALHIQICLHTARTLGELSKNPVQGGIGFFSLFFLPDLPPLALGALFLAFLLLRRGLRLGLLFKQIVKIIHHRLPLFRFGLLFGFGRLVPGCFLSRLLLGCSRLLGPGSLRLLLPLGLDVPQLLPDGRLLGSIRSTPCGLAAVL